EPGPPGAPERRIAHIEHGYPQAEVDGIARGGYEILQWEEINHYFGGVSAVGHAGAAGDPRRGGVGLMA
ncbi:MAG TPA: hypothetical protein VFM54_09115, partial [Micromonosporaceae bacterium]|nr:hypothetical protein [Micromonosporaceae bacterium]